MHTPVALVVFNRPKFAERVIQQIAHARPQKLFVIADGPRAGHPDDREKCAAVRGVIDRIDWDCEIYRNYSDANLGCGKRPASGLDWVFSQTDRAIILEDDCVPGSDFFRFCEEMLERYRNEPRVMQVCGTTQLDRQGPQPSSYYFSRHLICWGWATWARAWKSYDFRMSAWPDLRGKLWLEQILGDEAAAAYWRGLFDETYGNPDDIGHWDYQWQFAVWQQQGLAVVPNSNLITNIGFGEDSTHTGNPGSRYANMPARAMDYPLIHPPRIAPDREADSLFIRRNFSNRNKKGGAKKNWMGRLVNLLSGHR